MSQQPHHSPSHSAVWALPQITLVTGNKGKLAEVQAILSGIATIRNEAIDLPELQGSCTLEIAREKALLAFQTLNAPCVIEDTCLCFNAHKGLPGPYIKWYMDKIGCEGLVKTLTGFEDKTGYASCIFALCPDGKDVLLFEGRVDGTIVPPRGASGFGWDPIFQPCDESCHGKTYAEMTKEEKNLVSHRFRAVSKLKEYLLSVADSPSQPLKKRRMEGDDQEGRCEKVTSSQH